MPFQLNVEFLVPTWPGHKKKDRVRHLLVRSFRRMANRKFGGSTGWNPFMPAPYAGEWKRGRRTLPDLLQPLWVLVNVERADEALSEFTAWKYIFERVLNQREVLVRHSLTQTLGKLEKEKRKVADQQIAKLNCKIRNSSRK